MSNKTNELPIFFTRSVVKRNRCHHPYCDSQSVASSPDFLICDVQSNYPCTEVISSGLVDRHLGETTQTFLLKEIEENPNVLFNVIFDRKSKLELLEQLLEFKNTLCTVSMTPDLVFEELAQKFKNNQNRFHFYFPLNEFSPKKIESLKSRFPDWRFRPPATGRIYHQQWSNFEDRNPEAKMIKDFRNKKYAPEISIIIPTFNHHEELALTLEVLSRQNMDPSLFEVIIVDDGSNDPCLSVFESFIASFPNLNSMYVYLPRPARRRMGDNRYRSMVARNFGVSFSRSEILLFLDSDILLGEDLLLHIKEAHQEFDIIQPCRYHLTSEESKRALVRSDYIPSHFDELNLKTESRSQNYFEDFQSSTTDWGNLAFGWRYASTFCFSVKRDLFFKYSGFSKSFCFYGFEDVEFGYRLFSGGESFHLLKEKVLALNHETDRSEYCDSQEYKKELLTKSAILFYHQNLDSDIFHALEFYYL